MLTAPRKSQKFAGGGLLNVAVTALVACYGGGMAMLSSGVARPARAGQGGNDLVKAADVANSRIIGIFTSTATGGAADGDVRLDVEEGTFLFRNSSGADTIGASHVQRYCFVVDDETVAATSASGTRPRAGVVREVGADGVWVEIGAAISAGASRVMTLPFAISEVDTLAGTSAELVSPVAGRISKLSVIVQKAVTTGGDVTALVGVTAVAGLACTIPDAAAKGSVVEDTPTAGDATAIVAVGSRIQIAPGAPFNSAGAVSGFVELAY